MMYLEKGVYYINYYPENETTTVKEFWNRCENLAEMDETTYWLNPNHNPAVYGSDIPGSIMKSCKKFFWNLNNLRSTLTDCFSAPIPGVTTSYLN